MNEEQWTRFTLGFIIFYLIFNFLAVLLFKNIFYLFCFHWLVIIVLFIYSIINIFRRRTREDIAKKYMDKTSKVGYLFANYAQNAGHILFCYLGFFYMYSLLYLLIAYFTKRNMSKFYIISTFIVGLVVAFKETFLQFSQCIAARTKFSSINSPRCDKHYYNYWNCLQNKTFSIKK